jgi:hypothetical protein
VSLGFSFVITRILAMAITKFIAFKVCGYSYKLAVISLRLAIIVKVSNMIGFKVGNLVAFTFK